MRVSVVGISHPALCGVSQDSGQVAFEQEAIALFTLVKRLLRPLALSDVLVGSDDAGHLALPVPQGQFVSPDPLHISVALQERSKSFLPILSAGLFRPASVAKARLQPR